jgi:hypothetical protein
LATQDQHGRLKPLYPIAPNTSLAEYVVPVNADIGSIEGPPVVERVVAAHLVISAEAPQDRRG